jgi:hypothetical protein
MTAEAIFPRPEEFFLREARGQYTFALHIQAGRWSDGEADNPL